MQMNPSTSSSSSPMESSDSDAPLLFRCPISMELMRDPVTVSTGVTYERRNIERWLFSYGHRTCPATMQRLPSPISLTPNLTLLRLISSWSSSSSPSSSPHRHSSHDAASDLLRQIESSPFKVTPLKKLRSLVADDEDLAADLVRSGGIESLSRILLQVDPGETAGDFSGFRASEEAVGVLHLISLRDDASFDLLTAPETLRSMMALLQRGSAEARLHAATILQRIARSGRDRARSLAEQGGTEFYKSLLELLSDEASTSSSFSRASSAAAADVLVEVLAASSVRRGRPQAVEAGAVCVAVELLPEANRQRCERLLMLLKLLCECPEGRRAFADHAMGVAAVSKKLMRVSEVATKVGVKVLWLVCTMLPAERVVDEMLVFGAVKKMLGLLHVNGRSSTKERVVRMMKLHGGVWMQYPCFPSELKDYLRPVNALTSSPSPPTSIANSPHNTRRR